MADDQPPALEVGDDAGVGIEDVLTGPVPNRLGESAGVIHGNDHADPLRLAEPLVVLAESRRHVHHARALGGVHEVGAEHPEGPGGLSEVVE